MTVARTSSSRPRSVKRPAWSGGAHHRASSGRRRDGSYDVILRAEASSIDSSAAWWFPRSSSSTASPHADLPRRPSVAASVWPTLRGATDASSVSQGAGMLGGWMTRNAWMLRTVTQPTRLAPGSKRGDFDRLMLELAGRQHCRGAEPAPSSAPTVRSSIGSRQGDSNGCTKASTRRGVAGHVAPTSARVSRELGANTYRSVPRGCGDCRVAPKSSSNCAAASAQLVDDVTIHGLLPHGSRRHASARDQWRRRVLCDLALLVARRGSVLAPSTSRRGAFARDLVDVSRLKQWERIGVMRPGGRVVQGCSTTSSRRSARRTAHPSCSTPAHAFDRLYDRSAAARPLREPLVLARLRVARVEVCEFVRTSGMGGGGGTCSTTRVSVSSHPRLVRRVRHRRRARFRPNSRPTAPPAPRAPAPTRRADASQTHVVLGTDAWVSVVCRHGARVCVGLWRSTKRSNSQRHLRRRSLPTVSGTSDGGGKGSCDSIHENWPSAEKKSAPSPRRHA
jgi:hypothetical protein